MRTLIITGGSICDDFGIEIYRSEKWDTVISADSGLNFCYRTGIVPDLILGDFDSASAEIYKYYKERFTDRIKKFPVRKDGTDTELAVLAAIEEGSKEITILGATGTRLDHILANIQVMKGALESGVNCVITDPHNRVRLIDKDLTIEKEKQFGDYISLIPFTKEVRGLTLKGFSYCLDNYTLRSGNSLGVSNYITDDRAQITLKEGILIVIESRD